MSVKSGLGTDPVVGLLGGAVKKRKEYKVCNKLQEGKRPVYAVCFNFIDSRFYNVFATAGGNRVTIYQLLENNGIAVLQTYVDDDKEEAFYTVSWACDDSNSSLLIASGSNGVIRVINTGKEKLFKSLVGHGDSINELRTQALRPCLVVSASKDESVRLWNVNSGVCILIFAGSNGHRNEVLSVDFHPSNKDLISSCGMDNTVKIWSLKDFSIYVEQSFDWKDIGSKFPSKYVQFPIFTANVHSNYVDCTRWLGDFILSKSVDNEIVLWEALMKEHGGNNDGAVDVLQKYPVPDCDIWFIKFSCDFHFNSLAIEIPCKLVESRSRGEGVDYFSADGPPY
ncbi:hypothetical protein L7F22_012062 [Adiantum nelumboides]|nr:hypothetical protein [Adiantum nelumboides]